MSTSLRFFPVTFIGFIVILAVFSPTAVVSTALDKIVLREIPSPSINVTTDENGTVYISFSGLTVYKYVRTQMCIGWYNSSHIYVSYTGLYVDSPEDDLVPVKVELYNGTGDAKVLKYVFNATNFSVMETIYGNIVFQMEYYNVTGFTDITYIVYNMTDPGNPVVIYEGVLAVQPTTTLTAIYSSEYMSYLATLIPLAIFIMLAGRGKPKEIGMGLIIYGITILLLPHLGIYPTYSTLQFSLSIILGIIILFFSK